MNELLMNELLLTDGLTPRAVNGMTDEIFDDTTDADDKTDADATDEQSATESTIGPTEPVLVADGVSKAFGDVEVLRDLSLSVASGSATAIIGPNGAGKSTLLRTLAGVIPPTEGHVSYRGPEARREIGYLPQQPAFRSGFTARETLAFYTAFVGGEPDALLDSVGLEAAGDRRVEALSGGMRRLLGIAQATVGDPPVIVLDEPSSGLDPGMGRRMFEVVADLAAGGTAVLYSSHDLAQVERVADRVVVVDRGRVVDDGPPERLCRRHDAESLQDLFDALVADRSGSVAVSGVS